MVGSNLAFGALLMVVGFALSVGHREDAHRFYKRGSETSESRERIGLE
jgi:hypothetical protein